MSKWITVALMAATALATVGVTRLMGLGEPEENATQSTLPAAPPSPPGTIGASGTKPPVEGTAPADASPPVDLPAPTDVTQPGDVISGRHGDANGPAGQHAPQAIDDDPATKFFSIGENSGYVAPMNSTTGFTVTPSRGATVVTGLALTAGDDGPERDPASYVLEGSNDGTTFVLIAQGAIGKFPHRGARQAFAFVNAHSYTSYRLAFPTLADAASAIAMQIAEVELMGR